ncbi:hypothetical protein BDW59DRAFT_138822 [Aspergillus cavernicola]|uniref:Uncharacterized protein n=1 Tax=Aspergillus cavernicola TaxID=176166 RepID=A0ABR4IYM8_9EURO
MTRIETMAATVTCRHLSSGGYDHYGSQAGNNHNNNHSLHLAASTLAATPLYSNTEHDPPSSLTVAVPSLDIPSAAVDNTQPCHSFDLAGGVYILSTTSNRVHTSTSVAQDGMVDGSIPPSSDKLRTPRRKRTVSPPTRSPGEIRSSSRSTRHSGHSRQSSLHSHRRTNTTSSLTSVLDSPVRRENLLALHRDSCRLFQDHKPSNRRSSSPPQNTQRHLPGRTYSDFSSPPVTPILERQDSIIYPINSSSSQGNVPIQHVEITSSKTKPTVIEWTSPSTRRREYEAIDRASSGVRGFWRRVAPRWCQFGDSRVPFFEEAKDGKANYEGSVRRFRMDLPDEPEVQTRRGLKLKPKLVVHAIGGMKRKTS